MRRHQQRHIEHQPAFVLAGLAEKRLGIGGCTCTESFSEAHRYLTNTCGSLGGGSNQILSSIDPPAGAATGTGK